MLLTLEIRLALMPLTLLGHRATRPQADLQAEACATRAEAALQAHPGTRATKPAGGSGSYTAAPVAPC